MEGEPRDAREPPAQRVAHEAAHRARAAALVDKGGEGRAVARAAHVRRVDVNGADQRRDQREVVVDERGELALVLARQLDEQALLAARAAAAAIVEGRVAAVLRGEAALKGRDLEEVEGAVRNLRAAEADEAARRVRVRHVLRLLRRRRVRGLRTGRRPTHAKPWLARRVPFVDERREDQQHLARPAVAAAAGGIRRGREAADRAVEDIAQLALHEKVAVRAVEDPLRRAQRLHPEVAPWAAVVLLLLAAADGSLGDGDNVGEARAKRRGRDVRRSDAKERRDVRAVALREVDDALDQ